MDTVCSEDFEIVGVYQWPGALCRNLPRYLDVEVIMISRSAPENLSELERLNPNSKFLFIKSDLSSEEETRRLISSLTSTIPYCDLLVNNSAIYLDKATAKGPLSVLDVPLEIFAQTFRVNTLAPLALIQTFLPKMLSRNFGRIVNVSSGMARIGEYDQSSPAYRASKLALNGITLSVSHLLNNKDVICTSVCPGWVRTQMGGDSAVRSADEGCLGIIWSLLSTNKSTNGGFFRDGQRLSFENTTEADHFDPGVSKTFRSELSKQAADFRKKYQVSH